MPSLPPNGYPQAGDIIDGKYQIERMLGEGGMGAVARAIHLLLRAPVALKFMNPQFMTFPGAVERFLNEGIASKAIKSEHVVQVDDVGKLGSGAPYLVMDCLDGRDLSELLAAEGKPGLDIERSIHFVVQILRGLQVAHAIGIIHRDMKPSNCFVVKHEGQVDFVKILDFGISKVQQQGSQSLTQTNSALGTPLYMSPEQARSPRDVDARSDIYSVGVILYELLTGHTPFNSESGEFTEILFKLFTAEVPRIETARPDVSPGLAVVVHKALARDVADRFQSAAEFAEALGAFGTARTAALVDRMKHFQPESRSSIIPRAENSPSSALAFSALGAQGTTKHGAGPQLAPVAAGPQPNANAPNVNVAEAHAKTQISSQDLSAPVAAAQGMAQGMAQRTAQMTPQQYAHAQQPAVRTNLSVARDTTDAEVAEQTQPPRRSPLIFAIPAALVLIMIGGGIALRSKLGAAKPDSTGLVSTVTLPPPPTTPAPPEAPTQANSAGANGTTDTAKSAPTTTPLTQKPPHTQTQTTTTQPKPPTSTTTTTTNPHPNVLDNNLAN